MKIWPITNLKAEQIHLRFAKWNWKIFVSVESYEPRIVVKVFPYLQPIGGGIEYPIGSFNIKILSSDNKKTLLHPLFSSQHTSFSWNIDANLIFPTHFVVEVEFINIESSQTTDGDSYFFDGYERKPTTHLRELKLTDADSRLTLSGKIRAEFIKSKSSVLYDLFKGRDWISIEAIPHITINVLCAFTDYLYETLADKDIKKNALGLLEMARYYFIQDLTSTIEKSLARDVNIKNVASKLFLAKEYNLENLRNVCRELMVDFGKIGEVLECMDLEQLKIISEGLYGLVKGTAIGFLIQCKCNLQEMANNNFQGRTTRLHVSKWDWEITVCANSSKPRVEVKVFPYLQRIGSGFDYPIGSFEIMILNSTLKNKKVIASTGITDYGFSSLCTTYCWNIDVKLPNNFVVEVEFISIKSTETGDSDEYYFDGYERKLSTSLRELKLSGSLPDSQFIFLGNTINVHAHAVESKSPLLHRFFKYNGNDSISMDVEASPHITLDVLHAFTDFLYDTLADDEIKKNALGLLELARCYLIEDLTSAVENSLAIDVHTWNAASRILLAGEYNLEKLKNVCRELMVNFGKIWEILECLPMDLDQEELEMLSKALYRSVPM